MRDSHPADALLRGIDVTFASHILLAQQGIRASRQAYVTNFRGGSGLSVAEAARREKVSEQSIGRWKADFLEAGKTALAAGKSGLSTREEQLEAEVADLTRALGEAAVEIRVWKKSAEGRLGPVRTLR
jgi:transposase